ncbi:uncharacterized protein LOC144624784 [Crassostrea virginica]
MNNGQITASDDTLMAVMQNNYFATPFYYISIANIETSATFESLPFYKEETYRNSTGFSFITGGDRCLRFDYVIFEYNVGGFYVTSLTIEFECYFGYQDLAVDNIRISPLFCNSVTLNAEDPCDGVVSQNCENCAVTSSTCECQDGYTGQYCQKTPCQGVECNNGACVALSETQTECNCDPGWYGLVCNVEDVTYTCDFKTNVEPECFLAESTEDDHDFTRDQRLPAEHDRPQPQWGHITSTQKSMDNP